MRFVRSLCFWYTQPHVKIEYVQWCLRKMDNFFSFVISDNFVTENIAEPKWRNDIRSTWKLLLVQLHYPWLKKNKFISFLLL